ncbi:Phage P2 GpU [Laribacter hongkongensis HLHK9]|uniref:Phage P2 GpU n=1 Tax=Laribacter hongkongensis (strain HLHK9) TaxID=557598 RepID=C1D6Q1_LARHH|nr:phage tail protein [Laribacter hongkongensis]ACO74158.1 Phage P2 GpU [Laribacter hongkongensis HLHK9]
MILPAMMALGLFVFTLDTLPYQELRQQLGWRYPATSRVGRRPARQYVGPDEETLTLSGVLLPELTGGKRSLEMLRTMADQAKAWPLIDGVDGQMHGLFVITALETSRSIFFRDGAARRIEFTLSLARVEDEAADRLARLGNLSEQLLILAREALP